MASLARTLFGTVPPTSADAAIDHRTAVSGRDDRHADRPRLRGPRGDAAVTGGCLPARSAVHHPTRLRPRLLFQISLGERSAWPGAEPADPDTLCLLAARPCDASRHDRQPGPPRRGRRDAADIG